MTDSKTVVEDLAVWLTAVWDEEERLARFAPDMVERCYPAVGRLILALHSGDNDEPCQSYAGNWIYEPCETIRLLASPYADRPDFRPEWLVERQGVEQ